MLGILTGPSSWELGLLALLMGTLSYLCWSLLPRLTTTTAPRGIISLEVAGTKARAEALLNDWGDRGLLGAVRRSLYLDFAFIGGYATLACLLAVLLARLPNLDVLPRDHGPVVETVWPFAMLAAGGLDALENVALILLVPKGSTPPLKARTAAVIAATLAATAKFGLLLSGLSLALVVVGSSIMGHFI